MLVSGCQCLGQIMESETIQRRNKVTIAGTGAKTIIFAHGLGLDQTSWTEILPAFSDKYRIVTFDHVGCGLSDISFYDEKKYATLRGYADDLVEICEVFHLDDSIFVGHSVSAMIGVIASLKKGTCFSKMVFIAPSPHYIHDPELNDGGFPKDQLDSIITSIDRNYTEWVKSNIPTILNNPDKPQIEKSIVRSFLKVDQKIAKQFALATFFSDYRKELLKFNVPSLILQCKNDFMSPLQVGDYLHAHLDNNTLMILDANGHFPHLTDPKKVIKAIKGFLKR